MKRWQRDTLRSLGYGAASGAVVFFVIYKLLMAQPGAGFCNACGAFILAAPAGLIAGVAVAVVMGLILRRPSRSEHDAEFDEEPQDSDFRG